jgi:hypothetical protein
MPFDLIVESWGAASQRGASGGKGRVIASARSRSQKTQKTRKKKQKKQKQTGLFVPDKSNIWRDSCDGYLDWVKEHVRDGCSLDSSDACGDPPLVLAAGNGHLAVASFLLDEGASLDGARSVMGETALVRAAHNGHVDVVRFLLAKGADALAADLGGNTALHWAAMRGHVEVCAALLLLAPSTASAAGGGAASAASAGGAAASAPVSAAALKEARNAQGQTPVDLAQPQWSLSWRFVKELLEGGEGKGDEAAGGSRGERLGLAAAIPSLAAAAGDKKP